MARKDSVGLFWTDVAKVKAAPKEKIKNTPPERFWVSPDYLPNLEIAQQFKPDFYTDLELLAAARNKEQLLFDSEVYPNYCLFAFKSVTSGKVVQFEMGDNYELFYEKLNWVISNFTLINFNGRNYDFPILAIALKCSHTTQDLWQATKLIIEEGQRPYDVLKIYKVKALVVDQIDLIELTALGPSLKVCAGRLHAQRLQDLPFEPGTILTPDQITIVRWYCVNDLDNTGLLYQAVLPQVELRAEMSKRFKVDLRSHSDAQMAEAIINKEIKRVRGPKRIMPTELDRGTKYRYKTPHFIKFETPMMQEILRIVQTSIFEVNAAQGNIMMPEELSKLIIYMNKSKYKIGIGGLHSQEETIAHISDDEYFIADTDATSYYPRLILNAGLAPANLGKDFLMIYNALTDERIAAKKAGNKTVAECLKIVLNGTFGKLGSMYSIVYAPNLMMQVTVTGQLSILMLAERFELNNIEVTSINTDGIVTKCLHAKEALFKSIVAQWEKDTGFSTEEIRYKATYSRDINNYIAVYEIPEKGELFKTKGAYGKTAPKKNAVNEVCVDAVKAMIANSTPPISTIRACKDIRRFTTMRRISGGVVKGNEYLGKVVRWYYAVGVEGNLIIAKSGNKVPLSDGAKPCMDLPAEFPNDIDYDWYVNETYKILEDIGFSPKPVADVLTPQVRDLVPS